MKVCLKSAVGLSLRGRNSNCARGNLTIFVSLLVAASVMPVFASAATSAGVTPGSFWYFFDTASEKIALFFAFNPENKAKKALEYADERLAEIEAIAEEKNPDAVKTAIADYESNVALATEKSKEVKDRGQAESLLNSIEDSASKNQEVLSAVLIKVPEEAKAAIAQAIEASKRGQEEAARQITELKGEVEKLKQEVAELKAKDEERQAVEIDKLKREVEKLKGKSAAIPAPAKSTVPATPQAAEVVLPLQPITTKDYKMQALTILSVAKDNYIELINFSRECVSLISQRRAALQNASANRASWLSKVAFDSGLLAQQTLLYDLYDSEINSLNQYIYYCETTVPNAYDAIIGKINDSLATMQSPSKPIAVEQLADYQSTYFGANSGRVITFESVFANSSEKLVDGRTAIQNVIDRFRYFSNKNNATYQSASDTFWRYVDKATAPSVSPPQYNFPVPSLPQLPQVTRCTIGGIGGGGVELVVNCSSGSF